MALGKIDNSHLGTKLHLRRHFLEKYHAGKATRVLDCCCGSRALWDVLAKEHEVRYLGIDKKATGREHLRMDSIRFLEASGPLAFDVVDVDTYGEPWAHWFALLAREWDELTVFLTVGAVTTGAARNLSTRALEHMGLTFHEKLPAGLRGKLVERATSYCLTMSCDIVHTPLEALEATPSGSARYFGLRLKRGNHGALEQGGKERVLEGRTGASLAGLHPHPRRA